MTDSYYKEQYGSFYLYDPKGAIIHMVDEISMIYDAESYTLLKHGSAEALASYFEKARKVFPFVRIITFPKDFPLEEINKCLSNSNYLQVIFQNIGTK